jgi:hypothetical protein
LTFNSFFLTFNNNSTQLKTKIILAMENRDNKLRDACFEAYLFFEQSGDLGNNEIQSKLEFVVGSYDFDKNPVGLYEIGADALGILKEIKKKSPKKVDKKIIDDLEKGLKK